MARATSNGTVRRMDPLSPYQSNQLTTGGVGAHWSAASADQCKERRSPLLAVLLVGVALVVTWLLSGVPLRSMALFVGYELIYVLLPGCLLYALLGPGPGDRLRVVVIGWPMGYAIEIGAYALTAALHERAAFALLPLVALAVMGPPAIRRYPLRRLVDTIAGRDRRGLRRSRRIFADSLPRNEIVVLALVTTAGIAVLALTFFAAYPLPEHARSVVYHVDNVLGISLAAEARHHWPITEPYVAGLVPFHYYYGVFLHIAAINQVTGIPLSTTVLRLLPTSVIAVAALQLWLLGRALGRSPWIGPTAVALLLVVEDLNLDPTRPGAFGAEMFKVIPLSPTFALGIVFFLGLLALMQSWLDREGALDPATRYGGLGSALGAVGWLAMVSTLVLGMSMVKSVASVDFIGGLTLVWLWRAFTAGVNRLLFYCLALSTICAGVAYILVLRGPAAETLHVSLFNFIDFTNFAAILHMHTAARIVPLLGIVTLACVFTLVPLLGTCTLLWREDAVSPYVSFCLAVFVVSFAAYVTLALPGDAQGYFLGFGYIGLLPVAADGLIALWTDALPSARRRMIRACGVILALGMMAAASTLLLTNVRGIDLDAWYAAAYGLLGGAITIATVRLEKVFMPAIPSRAARLLACCIPLLGTLGLVKPLDAALPRAWKVITHTRISSLDSRQNQGMTAALYRGLIWVREHTNSCDLLAVNNHSIKAATTTNWSRYYYYSAFTERRIYLESWFQTSLGTKGREPFPARLALNELAVGRGDPGALHELRRQGVSYVLLDKTHGGGAAEPSSVSRLVFANSALDVYRLLGREDGTGARRKCGSAA